MAAKRGAKPISAPETVGPVLDGELLAERQQRVAEMKEVLASYSEDRDLVNQLVGQAQMAHAFSNFSELVRLSRLAKIKENKLYRALSGKKTPHGAEFAGTWEEFCALLGYSVDKIDTDLKNYREFGEEALESMSRMGIGYRELRQFRQLPLDSKEALIEAAKSGDKDGLLDLAEELIARQAKEKAALASEVEETRTAIEKEKAAKDKAINAASEASAKLQKLKLTLPQRNPDVTLRDMLRELGGRVRDVQEATAELVAGIDAITKHADENGLTVDEDMGTSVLNAIRPIIGFVSDLQTLRGIDAPARFIAMLLPPQGES